MDPSSSPLPSPAPEPSSPPPPEPEHPARSPWPFYVAGGLILLPGLFGLTGNADAAAIGALLFAPAGAVVAGIVLGVRLGRTTATKTLLSVALIVVCLVAAESVAAAGCAVSNPRFNFH
ncbi:MAG: hypothetical protein J0M24_20460 [Verrucomicrobia bacterium]|nr:hypothetical protein [Verrucomicrobiota bacterium]